MSYKLYSTAQGEYCIDWDTCCQIIRSYYRSQSQLSNSRTVTESQSGLNPLQWGLPDLSYVDVNWNQVHRDSESRTMGRAFELAAVANTDPQGIDRLVSTLRGMQQNTRSFNSTFSRLQQDASSRSHAALKQSENVYDTSIHALKVIRDSSAEFLLLIGASTVGLPAVAAGAALRVTAKYQDTGNLGVAAIQATQDLLITIIPAARGVPLQGSEKVMKIIVSAVLKTDQALLKGDEVGDTLRDFAVETGVDLGVDRFKGPIRKILNRTILPVVTKTLHASSLSTAKTLSGVAMDSVKAAATKAAQGALKGNGSVQHEIVRSRTNSTSWGGVISYNDHDNLLLKLAIIDMEKGIGRSWW